MEDGRGIEIAEAPQAHQDGQRDRRHHPIGVSHTLRTSLAYPARVTNLNEPVRHTIHHTGSFAHNQDHSGHAGPSKQYRDNHNRAEFTGR